MGTVGSEKSPAGLLGPWTLSKACSARFAALFPPDSLGQDLVSGRGCRRRRLSSPGSRRLPFHGDDQSVLVVGHALPDLARGHEVHGRGFRNTYAVSPACRPGMSAPGTWRSVNSRADSPSTGVTSRVTPSRRSVARPAPYACPGFPPPGTTWHSKRSRPNDLVISHAAAATTPAPRPAPEPLRTMTVTTKWISIGRGELAGILTDRQARSAESTRSNLRTSVHVLPLRATAAGASCRRPPPGRRPTCRRDPRRAAARPRRPFRATARGVVWTTESNPVEQQLRVGAGPSAGRHDTADDASATSDTSAASGRPHPPTDGRTFERGFACEAPRWAIAPREHPVPSGNSRVPREAECTRTGTRISAPFRALSAARAGARERSAVPRRTPPPHRTENPSSSPNGLGRSPRWTAR